MEIFRKVTSKRAVRKILGGQRRVKSFPCYEVEETKFRLTSGFKASKLWLELKREQLEI